MSCYDYAKYGILYGVSLVSIRIYRSDLFKVWYRDLSSKDKRIVDARIDIARNLNVLTNYKQLSKDYSLYEFKWRSGLRVYFALLSDTEGRFILLLIGGNKNTQEYDIRLSKKIILRAMAGVKRKGEKDE